MGTPPTMHATPCVRTIEKRCAIARSNIYRLLREAAICPHGAGYMLHESARFSAVHGKWFFMPRKLSREPYDEIRDTKK